MDCDWGRARHRIHGFGGPAIGRRAMTGLDRWILTLVTFIPAAAGFLLMLAPRRDREIRVYSLLVTLLTFVLSLHLPAHFHRNLSGFQFDLDIPWIPTPNIH